LIAYRRTPGFPNGELRPLVDVHLTDDLTVVHICLADTGANGNRLSAALAGPYGVALPRDPTGPDLISGGVRSQTYEARVPFTIEVDDEPVTWVAPVTFCDPWPHPFGLLGQRGFFDAFDVLFQGRDKTFTLTRAKP